MEDFAAPGRSIPRLLNKGCAKCTALQASALRRKAMKYISVSVPLSDKHLGLGTHCLPQKDWQHNDLDS